LITQRAENLGISITKTKTSTKNTNKVKATGEGAQAAGRDIITFNINTPLKEVEKSMLGVKGTIKGTTSYLVMVMDASGTMVLKSFTSLKEIQITYKELTKLGKRGGVNVYIAGEKTVVNQSTNIVNNFYTNIINVFRKEGKIKPSPTPPPIPLPKPDGGWLTRIWVFIKEHKMKPVYGLILATLATLVGVSAIAAGWGSLEDDTTGGKSGGGAPGDGDNASGGGGGTTTTTTKVVVTDGGDTPTWKWNEADKAFSSTLNDKFKKALSDKGISFGEEKIPTMDSIEESKLTFMGILAEQAVDSVDFTAELQKYGGAQEGRTYHYFKDGGNGLPKIEKRNNGKVTATYSASNMELETIETHSDEDTVGSETTAPLEICDGGCINDPKYGMDASIFTLTQLSEYKKVNLKDYEKNYMSIRPTNMEGKLPKVHEEIVGDLYVKDADSEVAFQDLSDVMSLVGESELLKIHEICKKYHELNLLELLDNYYKILMNGTDGIADDVSDAHWTAGSDELDGEGKTGTVKTLKDDILSWFGK